MWPYHKLIKQKYFKLSNRLTYTLIVVGVFILIGFGVFAFNTSNPSHFGHSSGELIVNWNDIQGIPSGFRDNIDNDRYRYTIPWTSITSRPSGLDDGDDYCQTCGGGSGGIRAVVPCDYNNADIKYSSDEEEKHDTRHYPFLEEIKKLLLNEKMVGKVRVTWQSKTVMNWILMELIKLPILQYS